MARKAYLFSRPGGAIIFGEPYGHAAFGIQTDDDGTCLVGGVELGGHSLSHVNDEMNFWTDHTKDPLTFMAAQVPHGPRTRYDMAKVLAADNPNVDAAQAVIKRIAATDYNLLKQNCLTDTVEVLQAFGVSGIPGGARPSGVFGGARGEIVPLTAPWPDPGYMLDASFYDQTDQFGIRTDVSAAAGDSVANENADERADGLEDAPTPVISSILLRRGFLALYPDHDFGGDPVVVTVGEILNVKATPWPDKTVRSWYASATAFDPSTPKSRV